MQVYQRWVQDVVYRGDDDLSSISALGAGCG